MFEFFGDSAEYDEEDSEEMFNLVCGFNQYHILTTILIVVLVCEMLFEKLVIYQNKDINWFDKSLILA